MNNLVVNEAMNYRYDNPGQKIKVDELIVEKAKNIENVETLERIENFVSLSDETNAYRFMQSLVATKKNINTKARIK